MNFLSVSVSLEHSSLFPEQMGPGGPCLRLRMVVRAGLMKTGLESPPSTAHKLLRKPFNVREADFRECVTTKGLINLYMAFKKIYKALKGLCLKAKIARNCPKCLQNRLK